MEAMKDVMEYVMSVADTVAEVHLTAKTAAVTAKVRSVYSESQERKEHEQRLEVGLAGVSEV